MVGASIASTMLLTTLRDIQRAQDTSTLFAALGYAPDAQPFGDGATVVARWKGFKVVAIDAADPKDAVRSLARSLAGNSPRALAVAVRAPTEIALAAPKLGAPGVSRVFVVPLADPPPIVLQHLEQFRPKPSSNGLTHALRVQELLATEIVGERFYSSFRLVLDRMAASLGRVATARDRRLAALLPLTRVLFLYFVQAKGWLDGRSDYLRTLLDDALAGRQHFQRVSLDPLFFKTLNRPAASRRGVLHLGKIPYLNGGLFQAHPVELRLRPVFSNELWRHAFEDLFEKFRFCVREADEVDAVAPDMLGRVFERVMESDSRHETGTFYTPENVVRQIVVAAIETALCDDPRLTPEHVARIVHAKPLEPALRPHARRRLRRLKILDPAVGSGAFLLGALDELCGMHMALRSDQRPTSRLRMRRRILLENLFGVDLNPIAVRLAELRLWLAVIADDPCSDIDAIEPLPNLDGLVRQGDSLFDPIAMACVFGARPTSATRRSAVAVATARADLFAARGTDQRRATRRLRSAELSLAQELLEKAQSSAEHAIKDLAAAARGRDLFGRRVGLTPPQRRAYRALRAHRSSLRRALESVRENAIPFFSYEVHAPEAMRQGGFSIVVGNPPWVRAERLSPGMRHTLKSRFSWWSASSGRGFSHLPDLSIAFLQRALELTEKGGAVGFLMPSKLTTAGYAQSARSHIVRETMVRYLHRIPEREASQFGATTYPLALVLKKRPAAGNHRVRLGFDSAPTVTQQSLSSPGPWILVPERARSALEDFRQSGTPLAQVAPPALGVKTGADRIFVGQAVEPGPVVTKVLFGGTVVPVETELLRPLIRGRDIAAFVVTPVKVILWTHDARGRVLDRLPPLAARHIAAHRRTLMARADYTDGPIWTLFRVRAALSEHRVIWPDIAKGPVAVSLDHTPASAALPLNSCYVSVAPDRHTALTICAVMNSTLSRALVRLTADEARGGYRRVNARIASQIPVPPSGAAVDHLLHMSARYHQGVGFHQSDLDEAVAQALALPAATRDVLCRLAHDHR